MMRTTTNERRGGFGFFGDDKEKVIEVEKKRLEEKGMKVPK